MGTPPPNEKDMNPNRGTLGQPPMGGGDHLYLSAQQLNDRKGDLSWKAPKEKRGVSNAAIIALIVILVIALLVVLRVSGVL